MITIINMRTNDTYQRRVILEELSKVKTHPTADEVYEMARKRLPNISMATVYRNLDLMSKSNSIYKLDIAGRKKRFDADITKHYHLRCEDCGGVVDLELSQLEDIEKRLESLKGLEGIVDFSLEFKGKCKQCTESSVSKMKGVA
jgi:Fur family transcriptional regulator, peroxide stress response regulator